MNHVEIKDNSKEIRKITKGSENTSTLEAIVCCLFCSNESVAFQNVIEQNSFSWNISEFDDHLRRVHSKQIDYVVSCKSNKEEYIDQEDESTALSSINPTAEKPQLTANETICTSSQKGNDSCGIYVEKQIKEITRQCDVCPSIESSKGNE